MESLHLSRSIVDNLNFSYSNNISIQRQLQTGNRINKPIDDLGEASKLSKLKLEKLSNSKIKHNLQNSISFLQSQEQKLKIVSKILTRMGELKTFSDSPIADKSTKVIYDNEFKELQEEIRDIGASKWNGISLFSSQASRVLVGDAIDDPTLYQGNSGISPDSTNSMTRWGIYHGLADKLKAGDKLPSGFGENPPKNFLAFTITDESRSSETFKAYYGPHHPGEQRYQDDLDSWTGFIGEKNLDAKIAAVVVQQSAWKDSNYGGPKDGGALLPHTMSEPDDLPPFTKAYRGMVRESSGQDPYTDTAAIDFLKNAFNDITKGGVELPDAMGFFVDNSGSTRFTQVNQAILGFKQWVEDNYGVGVGGPITTSSKTDPAYIADPEGESAPSGLGKTGWVDGVWMAGYEDWIEQSRSAINDMITNDTDISEAIGDGTLDTSESGVKGLLDPVYTITDFDQEELQMFLEKCTEAISVNAAEQQRFKSEYNELSIKDTGLEKYFEQAEGLDIPSAVGVLQRSRVQMDINANLMGAVKEMENVLYTDFL